MYMMPVPQHLIGPLNGQHRAAFHIDADRIFSMAFASAMSSADDDVSFAYTLARESPNNFADA